MQAARSHPPKIHARHDCRARTRASFAQPSGVVHSAQRTLPVVRLACMYLYYTRYVNIARPSDEHVALGHDEQAFLDLVQGPRSERLRSHPEEVPEYGARLPAGWVPLYMQTQFRAYTLQPREAPF